MTPTPSGRPDPPVGPGALPVEAAVDGHPAAVIPMPRTAAGHTDWRALAALLPTRPLDGPQLPEPEGWVRIPLAGADQTLYLAEGSRYEGIMPEISLRRLPSSRGGSAPARSPARFPDELLIGEGTAGGLPLGAEPYMAGPWSGVHVSWSLSRYSSTVIRRQWILDGGPHGLVEVVAQHNAYLSRYLTPMLDGMVAGITTGPPSAGGLDAATLTAETTETPAAQDPAGMPWAVAAASRAREVLASAAPAGLEIPTARETAERDRLVAGFGGGGPGWAITSGGDGAGAGLVRLGRYTRDDAADLVLRAVGHRPEGPSDVPVSLLPAEAFSARLHDCTVPLPPEIPEGAVVSSHLGPQDIYRWWTADWSWWSLHREAGPGRPPEGIRVLTVAGFGHYLWDAGDSIRLRPVDGLSLYGIVAALVME